MEEMIVFDVDGVLAEVSESYREGVVETVQFFTGKRITRELVQDYKNRGGYNNDWLLSQKISSDLGVEVRYQTVVDQFNKVFFGTNNDGLIARESWFPKPGLLERLGQQYELSLFTGRLQCELDITLNRFARDVKFDPVICAEHVREGKPSPEGLELIRERRPGRELFYVGDTVDDARSSRAAGVPFIGIVADSHLSRAEILRLFEEEHAIAVIENVNQIEEVLGTR
jgi:HAD superfamily hydrolase (TIGR01548 family)